MIIKDKTSEEKIEQVKELRPIDDVFFEVLAEDPGVCEEILRVIMNDEGLVVESVIVQSSKRNIYGRSVRLDTLCILSSGKRVNIEVQRSDNDDHLRRVRFNSASITVKDSQIGGAFKEIVDVYVVYISQFDIFKGNSPIYHVDKVVRETGETIDDGSAEIYVNTTIKDGSNVSDLMDCFTQKMVDNPKFPRLSNRVKWLKTTKGGAVAVCEVMERYQAEAVSKADREASIRTLVESYCDFDASRETIINKLISKFQLTETEASAKYEQYAPILK